MTDISKATPRPWQIAYRRRNSLRVGITGGTGSMAWYDLARVVVRMEGDFEDSIPGMANAALIVRAVNSYDAMLAALKMVEARLDPIGADDGPMWQQIRAAIRLAEGTENAP